MKYNIFTPFRTIFNLDTDMAVLEYDSAYRLISEACQELSEKDCLSVRSAMPEPKRGYRKYSTLGNDFEFFSSSPVAIVTLPDEQLPSLSDVLHLSAIAHGLDPAPEQSIGVVSGAKIYIYDNTISVMVVSVEINSIVLENVIDLGQIDAITTSFSDELCKRVAAPAVELFTGSILAAVRDRRLWPHAKPLIESSKTFIAFDDIAEMQFPKWDPDVSPLIWTQRTVTLARIMHQA